MHRRDGKLIVSATDLVGFLECGHLSALDQAVADGQLQMPFYKDATLDLIRDRGGRHEGRYIELLEAAGRHITRLDGDRGRPYEERAAETVAAMVRGDDVIYQATVFDGTWVGHPDFLLRVPAAAGADGFGSEPIDITDPGLGSDVGTGGGLGTRGGLGTGWHYEVADTKLAHSAKASALIQICSYVDQIERIQGVTPEKVYVVTGGAEVQELPFRTAEMMAYYRHAKARFERALDQGLDLESSYPEPVEHCGVCRWKTTCEKRWHDDDALPIVAGVTRSQRTELKLLGVATRGSLATAPGLDRKFERVANQARVQVESDNKKPPVHELLQPEKDGSGAWLADRGLSALPTPSVGDLFFDIEGDPFAFWEGLEYLFGIWESGSGDGLWEQGSYRGLWAKTREEEKAAFEHTIDLFVARLEQYPDMHVYHFGAYEPSHLKRLAGRHATREEELDELLRKRVFVDLYRVVRQGLRAGVESYSIKRLEDLYGYHREIDLREAGDSIVEFELWLDGWLEDGIDDQKILRDIEAYNRDDCVSTQRLRDWLEYELRPRAAQQFGGELPRPPTEIRQTSQDLTDRQAKVHALEERLKAAGDDTTTLLANLLDWHRRENKASWWRFYDLLDKSDADMLDETEPIGGLQFEAKWPKGGRSRSDIYRYRFPAQEHKVDAGDEVHDPRLPEGATKTGTVETIDDDVLTVDIRRPPDWAGQHPQSIVPLKIFGAKAQQDALMSIGEWVADNGIDAPAPAWLAARDLLLRLAPRVAGGDGGPLARSGEPGRDAAMRLAPLLDGTTLAIQGPPGSGKTSTGAQMILELVRAGRKVAISSNSHKVICNLLTAVLSAADAGQTVRIVQKGKEHEALDRGVHRVEDNDKVLEALRDDEADIGAGTPWVWADGDLSGVVDTLFVDEAGQVSLANVVAMSGAARNVVLLGDPQQLDQPVQGSHPEGAEKSALAHFLGDEETVSDERGIFFERTWRLHPDICRFTSEQFYEGRLDPVDGLVRQSVVGDDGLSGSGLRWVPVKHDGNTNESPEEAAVVGDIVRRLVGRSWTNKDGQSRPIEQEDVLIVSPFNAHRLRIGRLLKEAGLPQVQVGTVDKFQGQQAPVSIYTMATSRPEDAPRGMGFLYSLNRLNVATSRARALAIVVCTPALLAAVARTPEQLRMANGLCAFVEDAR